MHGLMNVRPAVGLIQPPIHWERDVISRGIKRQWHFATIQFRIGAIL